MVHHNDPDLVWVQDAVKDYQLSRTTLDSLVDRDRIHEVRFLGDKRVYFRRSELDRVLGQPSTDVPDQGANNAG